MFARFRAGCRRERGARGHRNLSDLGSRRAVILLGDIASENTGETAELLPGRSSEARSVTRGATITMARPIPEVSPVKTPASPDAPSWLLPREAAAFARTGLSTIYREVRAGRLKAARINGRRELRIRPAWISEWMEAAAKNDDARHRRPGA